MFVTTIVNVFSPSVSVGLSITFGQLDIVNIAHPAFVIVGSYIAWILNSRYGLDPVLVGILAGVGLPDHLEVRLGVEERFEPGAEHTVVIGEKDRDVLGHRGHPEVTRSIRGPM